MGQQREGRGERGYVLILTALAIVPLLLSVAFATDLGAWYAYGTRQQRAVDAAALAGVVWLPDVDKARQVAIDTARRNGYDDSDPDVTVTVSEELGQRLRVTIEAPAPLFFAGLVLDDMNLTRTAVAEYVLAVPLGSPRNFLGTGILGNSQMPPDGQENLLLSINGYCTYKIQGDQKASFYNGTSGNNCPGPQQNADYSPTNYEVYVELPEGRGYDTDVLIFDGSYHQNDGSTDCYNPSQKYTEACDFNPGGHPQSGMSTRFELFEADDTPLSDSDNPSIFQTGRCSSTGSGHRGLATFGPDVTDTGYRFLPTGIDNPGGTNQDPSFWQLCRIPASMPAGRYILRITNQNSPSSPQLTQGSNNYAIVATPSTNHRLCDARTDTTCPRVFAKDYLSVRLVGGGTRAQFFLAEIGSEHAGKKVQVTLWDPAEGASELRIQRPTGANSWAYQTFDWSATSGTGQTGVTRINVAANNFNNHLVTLEWTLPADYSPPAGNAWWRIEYSSGSNVTDRTTWSVRLLGDPVHLVE